MILLKKNLLFLIMNFSILLNFSFAQESYLIKKKTNDDKAFKSQGEHSSDLKKEKYIKKKIKEIE